MAPTDGQILKWDELSGKYVASTDESGASAQERPETTFLGDLMTYPNQGSFGNANDIQYTRVFLYAGTTMVSMETFLEALPGEQAHEVGREA